MEKVTIGQVLCNFYNELFSGDPDRFIYAIIDYHNARHNYPCLGLPAYLPEPYPPFVNIGIEVLGNFNQSVFLDYGDISIFETRYDIAECFSSAIGSLPKGVSVSIERTKKNYYNIIDYLKGDNLSLPDTSAGNDELERLMQTQREYYNYIFSPIKRKKGVKLYYGIHNVMIIQQINIEGLPFTIRTLIPKESLLSGYAHHTAIINKLEKIIDACPTMKTTVFGSYTAINGTVKKQYVNCEGYKLPWFHFEND